MNTQESTATSIPFGLTPTHKSILFREGQARD